MHSTRLCSQRGLAGLEFAAGIPGTVGGWIAMNAGIPGREMVDVVSEVEVASPTGRIRHLEVDELHFRYRALRGGSGGGRGAGSGRGNGSQKPPPRLRRVK